MSQPMYTSSVLFVLATAILVTAVPEPAYSRQISRPLAAVVPAFLSAVDTMKESRDTETRPLSDAAIAADVTLAAQLHPAFITVDTHFEYPAYMQRWVTAIRATGRHVWFRIHPNQWGDNNGTTGIMTPASYESAEQAFLQAHSALFQPGDILDPCPEPENGHYWLATYGSGWTAHAPNPATQEYNAFLRATSDIADAVLQGAGIFGVITTVRSTNAFFATHPGPLEAATVARMGRVTVDSYPDQNLTDPSAAAAARVSEYQAIYAAWGVPVVVGEMGYSNTLAVDDAQQQAVLRAEFAALEGLPFLSGLNYWVGAGTDNSGGYTHVFTGTTGAWALRPAAHDLAAFFASEQQGNASATPTPSSTATNTPTATPTTTPTNTPAPTEPPATATATGVPTATPTPPANTATSTATPISMPTVTATPQPASTSVPATNTPPPPISATPTSRGTSTPSTTMTPILPPSTGVPFTSTPAATLVDGTTSPTYTATPSTTSTPLPTATPIGRHRHPGSQAHAGKVRSTKRIRRAGPRHVTTSHRPRTRKMVRHEVLE